MVLTEEERRKRREETERQMWMLRPFVVPVFLFATAVATWLLWHRIADGDLQSSVRYIGLAPAFTWFIVTICGLDIRVAIALAIAWIRSRASYPAYIFVPIILLTSQPPSVDLHFPGDAPLMFWLRFILNCNGLLMGAFGVWIALAIKRPTTAKAMD